LLTTNGANFVRYLYGAPVSLLALAVIAGNAGWSLPEASLRFVAFCALGGIAQIVATSLLIYAFTLRNFAVGTAYSKTETVQAALFATLLLAEPLSLWAWIGIAISLFGVWVLSMKGARGFAMVLTGWTQKSALVGIASGTGFAIAAVSIRAGSLSLPHGDFVTRAIMTLAVMNSLQTIMMAAYLAWRERSTIARVVATWRSSAIVGLLSVMGSACWALAMTLENAAHVRAVGQIELIFTFIASRYLLHERPSWGEILGALLVVGGVVTILLRGT
jgi:drug/metabolite transporter (DMT)-like permease